MSHNENLLTRRQVLRRAATGAVGAMAIPYFVPRTAFGANDRVRTGHIGVRNQGTNNLKKLLDNAVAVCDVDTAVLAKAASLVEKKHGKCLTYGDYRELLDNKDIDAVVITTPDHWHAKQTIDACQAGKDVYCEKPLTLCVAEGRRMVDVARATKRIVQTGSQQRSDARYRQACMLVRSGKIGPVQKVLAGLSDVNYEGPPVADSDPPAELNYDFWLGPAPQRPYNVKRVHYQFRFFWDYSGGQMTNWGAHNIDIGQWGLGQDDFGPVEFSGEAKYQPEGRYEVPMFQRATIRYLDGTVLQVGMDQPGGTTFIGTQGKIHVTRKEIKTEPAELAQIPLESLETQLTASTDHHANWLDCIRTRELPICDVEIGHRTATVCHLANIATRVGRTVRWDPTEEKVVRDPEAAAMLSRPYREPWSLG